MIKTICIIFSILIMATGLSVPANAMLVDRGNGLIYDSDLDITWLQNANLAQTNTFGVPGILSSGEMNWSTAMDWVAAMNSTNYLGHSNWRLPRTLPVNGSFYKYDYSYNGSSDYAYNISAPGSAYPVTGSSELAYMYYVNLGNRGAFDTAGNPQGGFGVSNAGPFINLANLPPPGAPTRWVIFWSETGYAPDPTYAWSFRFDVGMQISYETGPHGFFVWPVLSGDPAGPGAPPKVRLSQSSLSFSAIAGTDPADQAITILNAGGGTLNWTATADSTAPAWLSVSPKSGADDATLSFSVNSAGLSPGTYTKTVAI